MPDTDNGRVTLALLAQKLDQLAEKLNQIDIRTSHLMDDHEGRLRAVERCMPRTDAQMEAFGRELARHDEELEQVKKVSNFWNGANSFAAAFAAYLGFMK